LVGTFHMSFLFPTSESQRINFSSSLTITTMSLMKLWFTWSQKQTTEEELRILKTAVA
jgi:hypothetical protein